MSPLACPDTLGNGKYVGFHTEMAEVILADIQKTGSPKLDIKYQPVTSQNRVPLVNQRHRGPGVRLHHQQCCASKDVAFAVTTYVEEVRMVVKANSGIASIKDSSTARAWRPPRTTAVQTLRKNERAGGIHFKEVYGKDHARAP